jgi:uncharacterized protein DUF6979
MNKYGDAAVYAVKQYRNATTSPREAWDKATCKIFTPHSPSQKKGCPRNAFLGLCEEGLVIGFSKGSYTRSRKNKDYAIHALRLLKNDQNLANNVDGLWKAVTNDNEKKHNSQMDVVVALWNSGLLK